MKKLAAEFFGTFALLFAGTGAIVIDHATSGAVSHVGVALTFGLVVLAMIYTLGDISGAHLNPAVTLGFLAARRFEQRLAGPYLLSQCLGAVAASLVLRVIFPGESDLGATKEKGITAGIAVGSVIALEALFAGPISGASMNPARSLAPALVGGNFTGLWIYLAAPALGALLAVPVCCLIREKGCCAADAGRVCE